MITEGIYYASGEGSVTPDGLHRVEWEPFHVTYIKPGADLRRYDKVLVQEVTVSYKTPPRPASFDRDAIAPNYALPDSAIESMKRYFHEAFVKELGESQNFAVVEAPGPEVLLISGHIVNLQIQVPPEQDQAVDETDYTTSAGQMTLLLDARDSTSGELLVRVGQARAIQMSDGGWYRATPSATPVQCVKPSGPGLPTSDASWISSTPFPRCPRWIRRRPRSRAGPVIGVMGASRPGSKS